MTDSATHVDQNYPSQRKYVWDCKYHRKKMMHPGAQIYILKSFLWFLMPSYSEDFTQKETIPVWKKSFYFSYSVHYTLGRYSLEIID